MKKIQKILKGGVLAMLFALVIAGPVLVAGGCEYNESNLNNIGLSLRNSGDYIVKCPMRIGDKKDVVYGKTQADCAKIGSTTTRDDWCKDTDLMTAVSYIINTIIFIVGLLAVVMIIIGGINYATSQGEPGKVKKAKDTILYGIIGLVVSLLAYAIVSFVLGALQS